MKRLLTIAVLLTLAAGPVAAQQQQWQYANITTDATTQLKTSAGNLHAICVNTPAATGTITIYDGLTVSGTKIGTITSFAGGVVCQTYDVAFWTGLTIVTATAAPDITVSFR